MNLFRARRNARRSNGMSQEEINEYINREQSEIRRWVESRRNLQAPQPELPSYSEHGQMAVSNTERDTMDRNNETGDYERMPIRFEHDWEDTAAWTAHEEFEGVTSAAEEAQKLFDKVRTWEQLQIDMRNLRDMARTLHEVQHFGGGVPAGFTLSPIDIGDETRI